MNIELVRNIAVAVSLLGLFVGLGLISKPDWIRRISHASGHWITLRKAMKTMDKPIDIDSWVIGNGRSIGILMLLASLFVVFRVFSI